MVVRKCQESDTDLSEEIENVRFGSVEEDVIPGGVTGARRSRYCDFQVGKHGIGRSENGRNRTQGSV